MPRSRDAEKRLKFERLVLESLIDETLLDETLRRGAPTCPGAEPATPLVGVSRTAFDEGGALDVRLSAEDLLGAWR